MAKKQQDEFFYELSRIPIHHINISLDTFNPELYEKLRKGAVFNIFMDNLTRLTEIFRKSAHPPKIYYETMVLKENYKEIPEIIKTVNSTYLSSFIDIRPLWMYKHNAGWLKNEYINQSEYDDLKKMIAVLNYDFKLNELSSNPVVMDENDNDYTTLTPAFTALRISSNGQIEFLDRNVFFNLNDIKNPNNFFKDMLQMLSLDLSRALIISKEIPADILQKMNLLNSLVMIMLKFRKNKFLKIIYKIFIRPILKLIRLIKS